MKSKSMSNQYQIKMYVKSIFHVSKNVSAMYSAGNRDLKIIRMKINTLLNEY